MKKLALMIGVCALGATACSHLREPTDAQLTTLLRSNRITATDAAPPLDQRAIGCLRAWSGDATLLKGLPMNIAGEDGKKACHTELDTRLADAARNPDKFTFAEVTAPKAVRRALGLQETRNLAELANPTAQEIPPALLHKNVPTAPVPPGATFAPTDPTIDLGLAGTQLKEAQSLCEQTQQAAAAPGAKDNLKRYAAFCVGNLRRLQATMEIAGKNGRAQPELQKIATGANNMATVARNLLAGGKK